MRVVKVTAILVQRTAYATTINAFVVWTLTFHSLIWVVQVSPVLAQPKCNFNFTFMNCEIFFAGCVRLKYLSPEEGIAINVSYGESLLHNEIVKGPDPAPSCLNIFAKLAQMCARFHGLLPTDDGMRGCINLEPMLLGETQLEMPIGCFRMGPRGMEVIQSPAEVIEEQQPGSDKVDSNGTSSEAEGVDSLAGYSAEDILAAVNESAEQGIALLSNWLGLAPNATDEASSESNQSTDDGQQQLPPNIQQQSNVAPSENNGHVVFGS